jgi:hypothetical protein
MQPLQFAVPLGALEAVADVMPYAILVLVLANMVTRAISHRKHVKQAEDGEDALSRSIPHTLTNLLLILAAFAFMIVEPHGGMVLSVLVVSMFLADFFEFESRKVEARNDMSLEAPKGAITASLIVLLYAAYQSVFFIVVRSSPLATSGRSALATTGAVHDARRVRRTVACATAARSGANCVALRHGPRLRTRRGRGNRSVRYRRQERERSTGPRFGRFSWSFRGSAATPGPDASPG